MQGLVFGAHKNANFGHWRPKNDFLEHLKHNKNLGLFFQILAFLASPPQKKISLGGIGRVFLQFLLAFFKFWSLDPNDFWGHLEQKEI